MLTAAPFAHRTPFDIDTLLVCTAEPPVLLPSEDPRTIGTIPTPSEVAVVFTPAGESRPTEGMLIECVAVDHALEQVARNLAALRAGHRPRAWPLSPLTGLREILDGDRPWAWATTPGELTRLDGETIWQREPDAVMYVAARETPTWWLMQWMMSWQQHENPFRGDALWEVGDAEQTGRIICDHAATLHEQRERLARVFGAVSPLAFRRALAALTEHEQSAAMGAALVDLTEHHLVAAGTFAWEDVLLGNVDPETIEGMADGSRPTFGLLRAQTRQLVDQSSDSGHPLERHEAAAALRWIAAHADILANPRVAALAEAARRQCRRMR